jgi:hypothetical protein
MAEGTAVRGGDQSHLIEARKGGRLAAIDDVIERFGGRLRVQTAVAGEFEPKVLFVNPDLATIFARQIGALIEVVRLAAVVAIRFGVRVKELSAH